MWLCSQFRIDPRFTARRNKWFSKGSKHHGSYCCCEHEGTVWGRLPSHNHPPEQLSSSEMCGMDCIPSLSSRCVCADKGPRPIGRQPGSAGLSDRPSWVVGLAVESVGGSVCALGHWSEVSLCGQRDRPSHPSLSGTVPFSVRRPTITLRSPVSPYNPRPQLSLNSAPACPAGRIRTGLNAD